MTSYCSICMRFPSDFIQLALCSLSLTQQKSVQENNKEIGVSDEGPMRSENSI